MIFSRRKPIGPSTEAVEARDEARSIRKRADEIYSYREHLLETNHFADRIRRIYEGHA